MAKSEYSVEIDNYIAGFPDAVRAKLEEMRAIVRAAAPDAEERISYRMPGVYMNGMLVWYAAHTKHIGFYPTGSGIAAFQDELAGYKTSRGAVQFPLDKPLPRALITRMVKFRVKENGK